MHAPRLLAGLLLIAAARAEVKLPALFSEHMVVQSGVPVPVWGWAEPAEEISVSLSGQTQTTKAGADGRWAVRLEKLQAQTEPQTLTVAGRNRLTIRDVLVGEVWLCSGQSNMAMLVSGAKDYELERAAANLPQLRMFTVAGSRSVTAQSDCEGKWIVCTPEIVGRFSATAFFFGRELHRVQGGAVGLITSAVGGTLIESWISPDAQRASPALKDFFSQREKIMAAFDHATASERYRQAMERWNVAVATAKAANQPPPTKPSDPISTHAGITDVGGLFNGKIAPLIPYALRGVVWYQGESNASPERAPFYATQLRLLVQDWRQRWGSELPFAWVQLPKVKRTESWAHIREAMLKSLDVPRTGMAITIDLGESRNLHPFNKQDVGKRLAQWALGTVYGRKVATSGPLPAGHESRGREMVLRFRHTDGGLVAKDGELKGFLIAGVNRAWKPAQARIEGDTVIVSAPNVPQPIVVRYAWAADPVCNLYNGAGLPASPFRTDDWDSPAPEPKVARGRDLHVDPVAGHDANDGLAQPKKTIAAAIKIAQPGDTIHLQSVVYRDYAGFYGKKGEPGRPITLDGHGATLEGADPLEPAAWSEVTPGLFKNDNLLPRFDDAMLGRWFFLMNGRMNLMGRTSKGKSAPLKQPEDLQPGEWTFVKDPSREKPPSRQIYGAFFIKLAPGRTLADENIFVPVRSAGVQFSGDNAHLVIKNLTATHPYNDGFNIHGDCRDVVFENIRAIECGDDGISAHESAQYRVDGFVSIGNSTGICDTGSAQTTYNRVFIADCIGFDLYFLDTGRYTVTNAIVFSSAQRGLMVTGRENGDCRLTMENVLIRRSGPLHEGVVALHSTLTARSCTFENMEIKVTGTATYEDCLLNGKPLPDAGAKGAETAALLRSFDEKTRTFLAQ